MKRALLLGILMAMLLLRVNTVLGQSYIMTNGSTITTCSGTFYDPGGPDSNYHKNLNVTQTIMPATPGGCVQVTFISFVTEANRDLLTVYDGTSASGFPIGAYSGTDSNFTVTSYTGALTFVFTSDGSVQKAGWEAVISCGPCDTPPDHSENMHNGIDTVFCSQPARLFYDPGGPDMNYPHDLELTQTFVSSSPGMCLSVSFTSFNLESMYYNVTDYLSIYDGTSSDALLLGTYSGTTSPGSLTSSSGALTFVFHSDSSVNYSGWEATISCEECVDSQYVMHNGTDTIYCSQAGRLFYDPGGPNENYGSNSGFTQTFVSSNPNSCLQVTFTSLELEANYDKLLIYGTTTPTGTPIATLTGVQSNITIVSFSGTMTFVFTSDATVNKTGWEAVISCGDCPDPSSMHNGTETVYCSQSPISFYDPGGPTGNYSANQTFTQTFFTSDPNKCLQVTFTSFETESEYDKLKVYYGTSASGNAFETYSGSIPNGFTITSYTDALTFQFISNDSIQKAGWVATVSCIDCADTCFHTLPAQAATMPTPHFSGSAVVMWDVCTPHLAPPGITCKSTSPGIC